MRDGVIYVAKGAGYLDLAERSAASLRALNPGLAVDLFTDQPQVQAGLFDRVRAIPETGPTAKLACLPESRFERTLYMDCDTLVLAPFGDLFDILDRFELAVAHDVRRTSALIREGHAVDTPYAFPQMNCGVMLYRRSAAMDGFLADWQSRYRAAARIRDQVSFRDLVWQSDIRFYVLPPEFNLRRVTVLDAWEPLDARPTILHSHRLLQHLRGNPERLDTLPAIMVAERGARAEEWERLGLDAPVVPGADPAYPFHAAEALVGRDARAEPEPVAARMGG
jgi:hypothetical protein